MSSLNRNNDINRTLLSLVPGFKTDRDDEWVFYLPKEKRVWIADKRAKYLNILEEIEDLQTTEQVWPKTNRNATLEKISQKRAEWAAERARLLAKRDQLTTSITPTITEYKREATEARLADQLAQNTQRQRLYLDDPDAIEIDDDDEDDYMPKTQQPVKAEPNINNEAPPAQAEVNKPPNPAPPIKDPFIEGLSPLDAEILLELKTKILGYNCRDRVLKAIASFRARDENLKALQVFTEAMEKQVKSTSISKNK